LEITFAKTFEVSTNVPEDAEVIFSSVHNDLGDNTPIGVTLGTDGNTMVELHRFGSFDRSEPFNGWLSDVGQFVTFTFAFDDQVTNLNITVIDPYGTQHSVLNVFTSTFDLKYIGLTSE
jgi:hypothetical protein